jgi:hypothetical protein
MVKRFLILFIGFLLCLFYNTPAVSGVIIFADHFDDQPEGWTHTDPIADLTGETVGDWGWRSSWGGIEISSAHRHGDTGKGCKFHIKTSSGTTQGCVMGAYETGEYPVLYWGYWYKISSMDWGTAGVNFKMTRFYTGDDSFVPDLDRWSRYYWGYRRDGVYYRVNSNCRIPDTNWHKYVWEFQLESNYPSSDDGIIRIWMDDVLVHESTDMQWEGTVFKFKGEGTGAASVYMQGNIAGDYNGPEKDVYWDDFIYATTRQEVEDFLGGSSCTSQDHQACYDNDVYWYDSCNNREDKVEECNHGVSCGSYGSWYCQDSYTRKRDRTCNDRGCSAGACFDNQYTDSETQNCPAGDCATGQCVVQGGEILIEEHFDDANLDTRGWYDAGATQQTVVYDSGLGSNVCEITYNVGETTPVQAMRHLFQETDYINLKYKVKYDSNWQWTGLGYGPHEFYFMTNADEHDWKGPAWSPSTYYIQTSEALLKLGLQDSMNIDTNNIGVDLTGITENRAVAGCNGDSDGYPSRSCYESGGLWYNGKSWPSSSPQVTNNEWHNVEVSIKLNSIVGGIGVADGQINCWLDGQKIISLNDVLLRTGAMPDLKFNQILFAPYFHDGVPNTQTFWVDDIVVTNVTGTCTDVDGDGYGSPASSFCSHPELDCDDSNPDVNPGSPEICDNSLEDDCDGLEDCNDSDCSSHPSCQPSGERFIFHDSLPSGSYIFSGDPMEVSSENPYQGTASLKITGQGNWSNCRIKNLSVDVSSLDWEKAYLEFAIDNPIPINYVAVNLWGDGTKAPEQSFSLAGSGQYEVMQINMTDFAATQSGFGNSITQFMIGTNWENSINYLDEVKIVSPGGYHRADTNPQDGCITLQELLAFIKRWKISSQDVPMPELMEAIGLWNAGTGC